MGVRLGLPRRQLPVEAGGGLSKGRSFVGKDHLRCWWPAGMERNRSLIKAIVFPRGRKPEMAQTLDHRSNG